jgi:hypothetical protein
MEYKNYTSKNSVFENRYGGFDVNQNYLNIGFSFKL